MVYRIGAGACRRKGLGFDAISESHVHSIARTFWDGIVSSFCSRRCCLNCACCCLSVHCAIKPRGCLGLCVPARFPAWLLLFSRPPLLRLPRSTLGLNRSSFGAVNERVCNHQVVFSFVAIWVSRVERAAVPFCWILSRRNAQTPRSPTLILDSLTLRFSRFLQKFAASFSNSYFTTSSASFSSRKPLKARPM